MVPSFLNSNKVKNPQVKGKMKKLNLLWIVIIGLTLVISSCAKKEESDDDDSSSSSCVTSTTASGSITVGSETMSGVYASECITDLSSLSFPSDTKGGKFVYVVTGDSTGSRELILYSDTSCSTVSGSWKEGFTNITVGAASGSNYKVDYTKSTLKVLANTTAVKSTFEGWLTGAGVTLEIGEEKSLSDSGEARKNLWYVTSDTFKKGSHSSSDYPSDVGSDELKKTCQ